MQYSFQNLIIFQFGVVSRDLISHSDLTVVYYKTLFPRKIFMINYLISLDYPCQLPQIFHQSQLKLGSKTKTNNVTFNSE